MDHKKTSPKLLITPPSPHRKRLSIEASMIKQLNFKKQSSFQHSSKYSTPDVSKVRTESTPSNIFSVSDFWRVQQPNTLKNLTFTKINHEEDVINRFVSRVLINTQTNILQAFKKLLYPSQHQLKVKKINRQNRWFKRAAKVIAINSKINEQKALWRLQVEQEIPEKSTYHKFVDMVVYPQQYISFQAKFRALQSLQAMIQANQIQKIVIMFKNNSIQHSIKKKFLERVIKKELQGCSMALMKIKCLPDLNKYRRFYQIKQKLVNYLINQTNKKLNQTFQTIKDGVKTGTFKKAGAVSQIAKTTYRNLDKAFNRWTAFAKHQTQQIKREKVALVLQTLQKQQQLNFTHIFKGFDHNLRKKIAEKMERLMKIQQQFRKQTLKRTFKKWKKKENQWYSRIGRILALNTVLNQQTTLWRLRQTIK